MPRRLYCPEFSKGSASLDAEESHHAVNVLRLRNGDPLELFDGGGHIGVAAVTRADARRLVVTVTHVRSEPFDLRYRMTLAVAPPKRHRQGYLIEKCTELGVAAVWPMSVEHGVARPTDALQDKWRRRAIEAAKQARRAWVPAIEAPQTFGQTLGRRGTFHASYLADATNMALLFIDALARHDAGDALLVWIGPEAGWSDAERRQALDAGVTTITLGPTILRTETAAVAACAAVAGRSVGRDSSLTP